LSLAKSIAQHLSDVVSGTSIENLGICYVMSAPTGIQTRGVWVSLFGICSLSVSITNYAY